MRRISNAAGGLGNTGVGVVGYVLTKVGAGDYDFDWAPVGNGILSNGTSAISIPTVDEDIFYDVSTGFVHRFKQAGVDIGSWSTGGFSISTILSAISGEQSSEISTVRATHASFDAAVQELSVNRSQSTLFDFLRCVTDAGTTPDTRFRIDGEGRIHSDQPVIVSGADYAECFEWADGNPNGEDRVGYTVSLVGDKIRIAEDGDEVIGVVSAVPTIIANSHPLCWHGKYRRDAYGRVITLEDGSQFINPEFDPSRVYVPRIERKEYAAIGLMGQLAVRDGQETGSTWIPIKKINDSLTLFLVK